MKTMKILKILSIVFVFAFLSLYIFCTIFYDDADFCHDSGYCKEGLPLNTEIGPIVISEETCKLTKGVWLQEKECVNIKVCKPSKKTNNYNLLSQFFLIFSISEVR